MLSATKGDTKSLSSYFNIKSRGGYGCPLINEVHKKHPHMRRYSIQRILRETRAGVLEPGQALNLINRDFIILNNELFHSSINQFHYSVYNEQNSKKPRYYAGSTINIIPTIIAIIPIISRLVLEFIFYIMYPQLYNFNEKIINNSILAFDIE